MKSHPVITSLLIVTSLAATAFADRDRVFQLTEIVETSRGTTEQPVAVVEDLGDIRPLADKSLFKKMRFSVSLRGEYVSNALSAGNHGSGDFLLLPSINGAFDQPLGHGLSLSLNARIESFIYSRFDESSFWGIGGSAFLNYQPTKDSIRIYAGIEPSWYASIRSGDQLAEALALSAGVSKEWAFNRDQTIFFLGYNFSDHFSFPSADNRNSHRVTVGVTHQLRQSLHAHLYYSYQYSDYTSAPRQDSRNLVGLNFVYQFSNRWSGNASAYFVDNDSTTTRASYQTVGIGVGVAVHF